MSDNMTHNEILCVECISKLLYDESFRKETNQRIGVQVGR